MAVDSQEKRMSASGAGRTFMRSKLPGANDQAWRVASGHAYAGNTIAAPATLGGLYYRVVVMASMILDEETC